MKDFNSMTNVEVLHEIAEFLKKLEKGFNKLSDYLVETDDKSSDYALWNSFSLELEKVYNECDLRYAVLLQRINDLRIEVSEKKIRILQEEKAKLGGSISGKEVVEA